MKKEKKIVAIRPTPIKRDKIKLHYHPKALVEMFNEFLSLFKDLNGEDAQSINYMLEDVSKVLKWAEKRMNVKEEKVEEKDEK